MNIFKKSWFWIIVVAVVVAGGILVFMDGDDVALRVNEREFSQAEFDQVVDQVTQEFQMYGMQAGEEEIKEQATERLIQEALLLEYAEEKGLDASQEEIDEQFDEFMMMYGAQSEEEFLAQLEAEGFEDKKEVEEVLGLEVQINKLLEVYSDEVEISDEDLEEAYNEYAAQMEGMEGVEGMDQEVPSLGEIEDDLKADMVQQEATPLLLETIEGMREEADIEVFVDEGDVDEEIEEPEIDEGMQIQPEDGDIDGEEMEIEIDAEDIEDGEMELDPEDLQ